MIFTPGAALAQGDVILYESRTVQLKRCRHVPIQQLQDSVVNLHLMGTFHQRLRARRMTA